MKSPTAAGDQDEYGENLAGETFLQTPWKKPSKETAIQSGKYSRWKGGTASISSTTIRDFSELGVGVFLYLKFNVTVALLFVLLAINYTPVLLLFHQGNAGHALTASQRGQQGLATYTLGNVAFNPDTITSPSECINPNTTGTIDCTGTTVVAFDQSVATTGVSYAVASFVFLGCLIILAAFMWMKGMIVDDIGTTDAENLSPADYSIYVRGLPKDVTVADVRRHFDKRYDLSQQGLHFPVFGLSRGGVASFVGVGTLVVVLVAAMPVYSIRLEGMLLGPIIAIGGAVVLALFAAGVVWCKGIGKPVLRPTPLQRWAEGKHLWTEAKAKERAERARQGRRNSGKVAPEPGVNGAEEGSDYPVPEPYISPVLDVTHVDYDGDYLNSWVADVQLIHPCGKLIRRYMRQQGLLRSVLVQRAKVKKFTYTNNAEKKEKAMKELQRVENRIEQLNESIKKGNYIQLLDECCGAFVTFNNAESATRALEDYRYSDYKIMRYFQPAELMFHGANKSRHPLRVTEPPEPSDVLWENLELSDRNRSLRGTLTAIITFLLLIASFAIVYTAQIQKAEVAANTPDLSLCTTDIPSVFFGGPTLIPKNNTILHESRLDGLYCNNSVSRPRYYFGFEGLDYASLPDVQLRPTSNVTIPRRLLNGTSGFQLCDTGCTEPLSTQKQCSTLACFPRMKAWRDEGYQCKKYARSTIVGCYCFQELTRAIATDGLWKGGRRTITNERKVCSGYVSNYLWAQFLQVLAAVVVVFINSLLKSVLKRLAAFERHSSVSKMAASTTMKIFIAQLVNTAIILLIVNANAGKDIRLFSSVSILNGAYSDFSREWYTVVGVSLCITMGINVLMPHMSLIVHMVTDPVKRALGASGAVTQDQYNALYQGASFDIETRYALLLNTLFVTLLFGAGVPLLIVFAAVNFIITFFLDKLMLLRYYASPPNYDASLAQMCFNFLPLAFVLHVALSAWMLSNPDLMPAESVSPNSLYLADQDASGKLFFLSRVTRYTAFPLVLLLLVYSASWFVQHLFGQRALAVLKWVARRVRALFPAAAKSASLLDLTAEEDGGHDHEEKHYIPYTAVFEKRMSVDMYNEVQQSKMLPKEELAQGWRVREDGETLYKIWVENGQRDGIWHNRGSELRTWEVIRDSALHSYKVSLNKKYRLALHAIRKVAALSPRSPHATPSPSPCPEAPPAPHAAFTFNEVAAQESGPPPPTLAAAPVSSAMTITSVASVTSTDVSGPPAPTAAPPPVIPTDLSGAAAPGTAPGSTTTTAPAATSTESITTPAPVPATAPTSSTAPIDTPAPTTSAAPSMAPMASTTATTTTVTTATPAAVSSSDGNHASTTAMASSPVAPVSSTSSASAAEVPRPDEGSTSTGSATAVAVPTALTSSPTQPSPSEAKVMQSEEQRTVQPEQEQHQQPLPAETPIVPPDIAPTPPPAIQESGEEPSREAPTA